MPYCNTCGDHTDPEEICCPQCVERLNRVIECLQVLELSPGASAQDIKIAFRDLAKVWHPDRFDGDQRSAVYCDFTMASDAARHPESVWPRHPAHSRGAGINQGDSRRAPLPIGTSCWTIIIHRLHRRFEHRTFKVTYRTR